MKKTIQLFLICITLLLSLVFSSCDDSGVGSWPTSGLLNFNLKNFKRIDPCIDGIFEGWLKLDSSGVSYYYSLGRFNFSWAGSVVDTGGSPMIFKIAGDTINLFRTVASMVTLEPPGDHDQSPSPYVIISGPLTVANDSIYGCLTIGGDEALGSVGRKLIQGGHGNFMFDTPTDTNQSCFRGIWFCDTNQVSTLPTGIALPSSSAWKYEGWVADTNDPQFPVYYSTGKFSDPGYPDEDGAGPCAGSSQPYNKPGQDWVQSNCPPGKPTVVNMKVGYYQVFITIEPKFETPGSPAYASPFFVKLFRLPNIGPTTACRNISWMTFVLSQIATFPRATLKITYHRY